MRVLERSRFGADRGRRLTSQSIAVHSDMLVWSKDETPEGAALPILNALFSTIQYSMILAKIRPEHKGDRSTV